MKSSLQGNGVFFSGRNQADCDDIPTDPVSPGVWEGGRVHRHGTRHPDRHASLAGWQAPALHQLASHPGKSQFGVTSDQGKLSNYLIGF